MGEGEPEGAACAEESVMDDSELWLLFAAAGTLGGRSVLHETWAHQPERRRVRPDVVGLGEFADEMVVQYRKRFGYEEDEKPQAIFPDDAEEETSDEG